MQYIVSIFHTHTHADKEAIKVGPTRFQRLREAAHIPRRAGSGSSLSDRLNAAMRRHAKKKEGEESFQVRFVPRGTE